MSSSSNDSQSPPDDGLGWLNSVPEEDATTTKIETPSSMRGAGGKKSLAPPPAGRGPLNSTTAGVGPQFDAPRPDAVSVPDLPADLQTHDDPMADFFDGSAQPVVIDAPQIHATEAVTAEPTPKRPALPASVAKVGLAKTMVGGPALEVMSVEVKRDPRSDPDTFPPQDAPASQPLLHDLVLDPKPSIGAANVTNELSDLPEFGGALDAESLRAVRPARSMRSAMMIIGLVLISGAAATALSLGIIGGPPSRLRTPSTVAAKVSPPITAPAVTPPVVVAVPSPAATPPVVVAAPTPEPVAAPAPEPVTAAAPPAVVAVPVVATASGDPVAAGGALLESGNLDAAAAQYQAALAADAEDHHAMEGLARVHLARGEPQLALPFAEAIVKRRPKRESYRALLEQAKRAARR